MIPEHYRQALLTWIADQRGWGKDVRSDADLVAEILDVLVDAGAQFPEPPPKRWTVDLRDLYDNGAWIGTISTVHKAQVLADRLNEVDP